MVGELGLTCSVGVAPTKFVAKVASARCKPDGLLVVPAGQVLAFLHPLPVTVLWGVGARTAEPLRRLGIRTIGDLAATPRDTLRRAVGAAMAEQLGALAMGVDPRPVRADDVEKSISADHTVASDLTEPDEVRRELLRLSQEVARRVRERGFAARTVGIKIRFADFTTVTRVRTLPGWTDATATVFDTAAELYAGLGLDRPRIRLVGVKCENLREASARWPSSSASTTCCTPAGRVQQAGAAPDRGRPDAAGPVDGARRRGPPGRPRWAPGGSPTRVVDAARRRFGDGALGYATLLRAPGGPSAPERALTTAVRREHPTRGPQRTRVTGDPATVPKLNFRLANRDSYAHQGRGPRRWVQLPGTSFGRPSLFSHSLESAADLAVAAVKEGIVPLSEHEQRLLDEIEQALYAEDPKFASSVRAARGRRRVRTSALLCLAGVVVGLGLVLVGLLATLIPLSVVGFVMMVAGCGYGVQTLRHRSGATARGQADPAGRAGSANSFRSRMEERMRRRFEES